MCIFIHCGITVANILHMCVTVDSPVLPQLLTCKWSMQTGCFHQSGNLLSLQIASKVWKKEHETWDKLHKCLFFFYHAGTWLTAKCGNKSTRSKSAKPEISNTRVRWSTTACTGTPLPRPLDPLPLAEPRPRVKRPRPRPCVRIPLLAACVKK